MDALLPFFDPAVERSRFEARASFLRIQEALRVQLAPGIFLQAETRASVEDQVRETLQAEGKSLESVGPEELEEVRASFAMLSPRRDSDRISLAATLMLGLEESGREARLEALRGFPEQLQLELEDGSRLVPCVDRGSAGVEDRLPTVLALRYDLPPGAAPVAVLSGHPALQGRWTSRLLKDWPLLA